MTAAEQVPQSQSQSHPGTATAPLTPAYTTRRFVGVPRLTSPVEGLMFLVAWISFLLMMISYSAPAWKTYAAQTGDNFSIGLWSACRNNLCTYAWASYSPMTTVNPVTGRMQPALYFQDVTPAMVSTAQAFIMMGLLWHLFSTCCWVQGAASAALSLLFPSIFYTIGVATGISFFNEAQSQYKGDPANIVNLSWGYAAQCGFAAVIMMWIAVVVFSIIAIINRNKPREVMVVQEQYYVMNEAV